MLTIRDIVAQPEEIIARLAIKNVDAHETVQRLIALDGQRRMVQQQHDQILAELNKAAKEIGLLMKSGAREEAEAQKQLVAERKLQAQQQAEDLTRLEQEIHELLLALPNTPHHSVVAGKGEEDNEVIREGGTMPSLGADKLPHWELAKRYNLIDFETGVKITGAGFPIYQGKGARLQRALINYFLDKAAAAGFVETEVPLMVNEDSAYGTGQLPDKEGQMYHAQLDNLYLIPTAEVPLTNIFRDVIVDEGDLPLRRTAYSACFRREAGSYGKEVRGLNRLHQFDKVEIVCVDRPESSYDRLEEMVHYVEGIVTELGLPYRILRLCGGDLSFTSALTFDFEVYSAAQERWLEVSSVSNFESYQANRLKLRYRQAESKKTALCHTLNGSALALPRIVATLLENYQTPEGIIIPEVLRPYCGFDRID